MATVSLFLISDAHSCLDFCRNILCPKLEFNSFMPSYAVIYTDDDECSRDRTAEFSCS